MRHRLFRRVCQELVTTTKWERIVLFVPFVVLIIDADIFYYAWTHHKITLILLSSIVLILSSVEIIAVIKEIHEHIQYTQRYSTIEKMILNAVKKIPGKPTVGQVMVTLSNDASGEFSLFEIYPVVCEVLNSLYRDSDDIN
jgi:hypothetical protein